MKTQTFQTREEWLEARKCKITGSRLKNLIVKRGTGKKIGYYELIAERLGLSADDEDPMDRGTRLESEAIDKFKEVTKKKVNTDLLIWMRDDNENIAISPDGVISEKEAVEVKCLSSARHLEAYLTNQIPPEYEEQVLQYFIVNDKLQKLYFVFYDPRVTVKDFFFKEITREEVQEDVEDYLAYQKDILREINEIVTSLTF